MSSLGQVANVNSDVVRVTINGKQYEFSQDMIKKYPKLLDPNTRYMLGFDSLLPIIYDYPLSTIPESMLDDVSEKNQFLRNAERLDIKLSDDLILHLTSKLMKEVQECSEYIRNNVGKKGLQKMRRAYSNFCRFFCVSSEDPLSPLAARSFVPPNVSLSQAHLHGSMIHTRGRDARGWEEGELGVKKRVNEGQ